MAAQQPSQSSQTRFYDAYVFLRSAWSGHSDLDAWSAQDREELGRHLLVAKEAHDFLREHFASSLYRLKDLGFDIRRYEGRGSLEGRVEAYRYKPNTQALADAISLYLELEPYITGALDPERVRGVRELVRRGTPNETDLAGAYAAR